MASSLWRRLRDRVGENPAATQATQATLGAPVTAVMMHAGRVGSTVLGTMVGDRPDARWDGELYEPVRAAKVPEIGQGLAPAEVLRTRRATTPDDTYLFAVKYLWSHHLRALDIELDELIAMLDDGGVERWVMLHRRNHLRRVVSGAVGRAKRSYHQRTADGPASLQTVHLDLDDVPFGPGAPLLDVFAEMERGERELRALLGDRPQLWLSYEDDVEHGPEVGYAKICSFLDLPPHAIEVRLNKTTPFPMRDVVENWDEVVAALTGTPYAWMLDED